MAFGKRITGKSRVLRMVDEGRRKEDEDAFRSS